MEQQPILSWDTTEFYRNYAKNLVKDGEYQTFDEAYDNLSRESYSMEFEWEYLIEALTSALKKINQTSTWYVRVQNFGWRKTSGETEIIADEGEEFLSKILPDTDCTFYIFIECDVIRIQNFHHDSPTGDEWYTITPAEAG